MSRWPDETYVESTSTSTTEVAQRRTRRERLIKTIEDIGRHDIKNKLLDVYDQTHNDYNEER